MRLGPLFAKTGLARKGHSLYRSRNPGLRDGPAPERAGASAAAAAGNEYPMMGLSPPDAADPFRTPGGCVAAPWPAALARSVRTQASVHFSVAARLQQPRLQQLPAPAHDAARPGATAHLVDPQLRGACRDADSGLARGEADDPAVAIQRHRRCGALRIRQKLSGQLSASTGLSKTSGTTCASTASSPAPAEPGFRCSSAPTPPPAGPRAPPALPGPRVPGTQVPRQLNRAIANPQQAAHFKAHGLPEPAHLAIAPLVQHHAEGAVAAAGRIGPRRSPASPRCDRSAPGRPRVPRREAVARITCRSRAARAGAPGTRARTSLEGCMRR